MIIMGIDPGTSGGYAIIDMDGRMVAAGAMPTVKHTKGLRLDGPTFNDVVRQHQPTIAYVEQVHSRPRQQGQFVFGMTTGMIHGVLHANSVQVVEVPPQTWKGAYNIKRTGDMHKSDTKDIARETAARMFPEVMHLFARKKDDGIAEAALIAGYALFQAATERAKTITKIKRTRIKNDE